MPKASVLGPHADRVKTDLRLPKPLMKNVEAVCVKLGIPKNAFFTLAGALFLVNLAPSLKVKKGKLLLAEIKKLFQKVVSNVEKTF